MDKIKKKKTTLPDFSQDKSWIEIKNKMGIELTKEEKKILGKGN